MNLLTRADALSAGFLAVSTYNTLVSHPAFPGVLFKVLTNADNEGMFRGFAAIDPDGTIVIGSGRHAAKVLNPSSKHVHGPVLKARLTAGPPVPGSPASTMYSMYDVVYEARQNKRLLSADPAFLGIVSATGHIYGVRLKAGQFASWSSGPYYLDMGLVPGSGTVNRGTLPNGTPITPPEYLPLSGALGVSANGTNSPSPSPPVVWSSIMHVSVDRISEYTTLNNVKSGLRVLADRLPGDVPQAKRDLWYDTAVASLASRPTFLISRDEESVGESRALVFLDGVLKGSAMLTSFSTYVTGAAVAYGDDPLTRPALGDNPWAYISKTYSPPSNTHIRGSLLFDGEMNIDPFFNKVDYIPVPEFVVPGLKTSVVFKPVLMLSAVEGAGNIFPTVPDPTQVVVPPGTEDAFIASTRERILLPTELELQEYLVNNGASVASMVHALSAADKQLV